MEQNFICAICMELADDAVETGCCHHIFCNDCLTKYSENKCPTCRASHPTYTVQVSHLGRRIIGGMEMICSFNCGTKFPRSERKGHELHCINKPFTCPAMGCMFQSCREDFLNHLIKVHDTVLLQNSEKLFDGAANAIGVESEVDRIKTTVNFKKDRARLGETGKYYCSMPLDRCTCCNGYCGPINGCNCSACMKLDVYVRKLPRHWLVNKDGAACRKGTTGRHYCGRKAMTYDRNTDGYCGPTNGNNCRACKVIDSQCNNRYSNVWL